MKARLKLLPKEMLAVNRSRYPAGLICVDCGRLIASNPKSFNLSEEGRLTYVCFECRADAQSNSAKIAESVARSKAVARARRLRPPLRSLAPAEPLPQRRGESDAAYGRRAETWRTERALSLELLNHAAALDAPGGRATVRLPVPPGVHCPRCRRIDSHSLGCALRSLAARGAQEAVLSPSEAPDDQGQGGRKISPSEPKENKGLQIGFRLHPRPRGRPRKHESARARKREWATRQRAIASAVPAL